MHHTRYRAMLAAAVALITVMSGSAQAGAEPVGHPRRVLTDLDIAAMAPAQQAALLNPLRRLADAVDTAGKAIMPDQYGGVALNPNYGTVDVYLTDIRLGPILLHRASQIDRSAIVKLVRVHPSRYSQRTLRAAANRLWKATRGSAGVDSIDVLPQGDALHVGTYQRQDGAGVTALTAKATRIAGVTTIIDHTVPTKSTSTRTDDEGPWIAGAHIEVQHANRLPSGCTSGIPTVRDDGRPFLITAAHCSDAYNETVSTGVLSHVIGPVTMRDDLYDAIGIDTLASGGTAGLEWDGPGTDSFKLPLEGTARSYMDDFVCHDGYASAQANAANGAVCNIKVTIPYHLFYDEHGITRLGIRGMKVGAGNAVLEGDSGGLVFAIVNTTSRQVRGIVSAGSEFNAVPSFVDWTEANDIYISFGVHLAPCCAGRAAGPAPGGSGGGGSSGGSTFQSRRAAPAIAMPDGSFEVFARGTNNHLIEYWYTSASGWRSSDKGGDIRDTPVAVPTSNGGIEVFARGGDNMLKEWWYTPANGWRSASQGGSIASGPTAYYDANTGMLDVYARGTNNHLLEFWYTATNGWRTSDMGGDIRDAPVVLPELNGGIELFARGGDSTLQEWWYTPVNGWRSASQGGSIASAPTAYYDANTGMLDVYARGTNNHLLEFWYTATNGWRTSDMGGDIRDTPVTLPATGGGIEVFAHGSDNTLREWWYTPATGWRSASQGGSIASGPTAFFASNGSIEVFARGTNNHLAEYRFVPTSGWQTADLGGDLGDV